MAKLPHSPSSESVKSSLSLRSASPTDERRASFSSEAALNSPLPPISTIPSTLTHWDSSPQSPSGENQRPFKSKSKHNLAVFGAKLTSTAASVGAHASKYKQRDKDSMKEVNRDTNLMDVPESLSQYHDATSSVLNSPSSLPLGGNTNSLKSKMFKQSKSDLKSLRIKTDLGLNAARSSLNDRSPMVRGGSTKELDRIAAIGQIGSPIQMNDVAHGGSGQQHHLHHLHHPHINFRKRDSSAAILSSSASNSTLASEGTVYSFNPTDKDGPSSAVTSLHSFKTVEDATSFLTRSWQMLTSMIQSVYSRDEKPRVPVEDINVVVLLHFSTHYNYGGTGLELLTRLDELLISSLKASPIVPSTPSLESVAESWQYFYCKILCALEATFLPLQLEFEGCGQVLTKPQAAKDYWYPVSGGRPSSVHRSSGARQKQPKLNIRRRILASFRDGVLVPIYPKIQKQLEEVGLGFSQVPHEVALSILLCFTTLAQAHSQGTSQKLIEQALLLIQDSLSRRARSGPELKGSVRRAEKT